jgi:hypothetical protein
VLTSELDAECGKAGYMLGNFSRPLRQAQCKFFGTGPVTSRLLIGSSERWPTGITESGGESRITHSLAPKVELEVPRLGFPVRRSDVDKRHMAFSKPHTWPLIGAA